MDVGIIGAGVAGLSAAYDLVRAGHTVTVYEARPYVGGLASGFRDEHWDWPLERFYHHIFASDRAILRLADELGWGDKVFFPAPITSIYKDGKLYPINKPWLPDGAEQWPLVGKPLVRVTDLLAAAFGVLAFRPISLWDRLRVGLVTAYLRYNPRWQPMERVTADAWLTRAVGERAYAAFWQPLLEGKFGPYYRDVNLAWFWARITARTPRLGYFEGGFQSFLDALAAQVRARGAQIRLETHVRGIHPLPDGRLRLELRSGDVVHERVLATCSPQMLKERTPALPPDYAADLLRLKSMGAVVLVLALKHRLTPDQYWINIPKREGFPFLALVEHTNYISPEHYGGDHVVYCGDYLEPGHPYFELEPEALLERFIPALQRLNPAFERSWIRKVWKFSESYAQPVPLLEHSRAIPPLQTPIPNLYMANMSQVYPWDRGTNFAVEIGRRAAQLILNS